MVQLGLDVPGDLLLDREQVLVDVGRDPGDVHAEGFDRFAGSPGVRGDLCRESRRDRDGDRRRSRDFCRSDVVMDWYGGEWALYNNRSWDPDSYNDWWHDRPDRAYPAWMRHNEGCPRQWYAADTLRC